MQSNMGTSLEIKELPVLKEKSLLSRCYNLIDCIR